MDCEGWCVFADGGTQKSPESSHVRLSDAVIPECEISILFGHVVCKREHPPFEGASVRSNQSAELAVFVEALRPILRRDFFSGGARVLILFDSKLAARLAFGVSPAERNIPLSDACHPLLFFTLKGQCVCLSFACTVKQGNAGKESADIAASLGRRG